MDLVLTETNEKVKIYENMSSFVTIFIKIFLLYLFLHKCFNYVIVFVNIHHHIIFSINVEMASESGILKLVNNKHEENMAEMLKTIFVTKEYSDVIIDVNNEVIKAHRAVLASRSSFFKRILDNNPEVDCICIPGLNPIIFNKILKAMYCGSSLVNVAHLEELLYTASVVE